MGHRGRFETSIEAVSFRRGLLIGLDGVALWTVAILSTGYFTRSTPWSSVFGVIESTNAYWWRWVNSTGIEFFEAVAYLGLAVTVLGITWYWVCRPIYVLFTTR